MRASVVEGFAPNSGSFHRRSNGCIDKCVGVLQVFGKTGNDKAIGRWVGEGDLNHGLVDLVSSINARQLVETIWLVTASWEIGVIKGIESVSELRAKRGKGGLGGESQFVDVLKSS